MFSLNKVGDMRFDLNDMSGALADYDEALAIARKLVEKPTAAIRDPSATSRSASTRSAT